MVRIPAFHAGGPGSIPGVGTCFVCFREVSIEIRNKSIEIRTLGINMSCVAL